MTPKYIYRDEQVTMVYGRRIQFDTLDPAYGLVWDQKVAAVKFDDAEHYVLDIIERVKQAYKAKHPEINNVVKNGTTYNYLRESNGWSDDGNGYWWRLSHHIGNIDESFKSQDITLAEYHIHSAKVIEKIEWK